MRLLFTDTETGGLNPQTDALLEVAFVVWEDGVELAGKSWKIKTGNKKWYWSALEINNIAIEEHNNIAIDRDVAAFEIMEFLDEWFPEAKATLAGHNVSFDRDFIKVLIEENSDHSFDAFVSHRLLDTMSILNFLVANHKLSDDVLSSDGAFRHFGIVAENRHTAMGDVEATITLFDHLSEFI